MIVDAHCHVFNADDLPVRGFVSRVALHREDHGNALVALVDRVVQGRAPGYQTDHDRLVGLLGTRRSGEESVAPGPDLDAEVEVELRDLQAQHPELLAAVTRAVAEHDLTSVGVDPPLVDVEGEELFSLDDARRAIRWALLFTRSRADLPAEYNRSVGGEVDLAVPMLVDLDTGVGDRAVTTLRQQVELLELVSRASMFDLLPGVRELRLHPFAPFDPLRELHARAAELVDTPLAIAQDAVMRFGFLGIKVYPPMGWRPVGNVARPGLPEADAQALDAIVDELASWCATESVPITAHCNDSNYAIPGHHDFGTPDQWLRLLAQHPDLHLNLGHFGGAHRSHDEYGWSRQIAEGMKTFEHLYGDVGCYRFDDSAVLDMFVQTLTEAADDPASEVGERLMFGTDWFMNAINPDAETFLTTISERYRQEFGAEATARFLSGNALAFLGLDPPTPSAERLRARYDRYKATMPSWLAP